MARRKKIILKAIKALTLFFISGMITACAVETYDKDVFIVDSQYYHQGCIFISAVKIDKNGIAIIQFVRKTVYDYQRDKCGVARVSAATTVPKKSITQANNLRADGSFSGSFTLSVKRQTEKILLSTTNYNGFSTTLEFEVAGYIRNAQALSQQKNWMTGLGTEDSKLVETKSDDQTAPEIFFSDPQLEKKNQKFVENYTFIIRGEAIDRDGILNVLVNGKRANLRADGSFAAKIKLGVGRNYVLVQAEDINNNVAETKLTIVREEFISEQTLVDVDMPPKTRMNNPDALAVVIGVESYQYVPDATYAYNDAEVFREYLAETMGMKRQRIKLATNSKATQAELNKLLGPNGWLARNITKGKSDIVVYFSGHGIASPDAKSSGLLPHDVDPNYSVGLQTTQLYQDLAAMGAKSVTVFLDACFTGQTRNSEMLIANARPIVIKPIAAAVPDNFTVISAASGAQISGALEEKEHGLFTYYLLKGLGGDADENKDKSINISELKSFVSAKVKEQAALNGREQTPEIQGSSDNVLVRFQ